MDEGKKERIILDCKYILLALLVGIIVGIVDTIFGRVLIAVSDFRVGHYRFLLSFLPVAGLLIMEMYQRFSKLSLKGMTLIFQTGQNKRNSIPLVLVPIQILATWVTNLFGGSAGREGVAVQIGATLSHALGRRFKLPENGRIILVAGMAAGFSGLFQTPLAAIFFSMEVIVAGYLEYEAMLPTVIAAYTACITSHVLGLHKFTAPLTETLDLTDVKNLIFILILGAVFGIVGRLFSFLLSKMKVVMAEKIRNPFLRIGVASIPLAVLLIVLYGGRYSGVGTNLIADSFQNGTIYSYDWILKLLLTVMTLAIGFQGGELTPLFAIGSSLGIVLGNLLGISPVICAALGYAAVFGSATNTLLAPIMIGVEIFGTANMIPIIMVCIIAYIMNGNTSIYSAQQEAVGMYLQEYFGRKKVDK